MPAPRFFQPKLLEALQGYSRQRLLRDIGAGVTVGVVALSQIKDFLGLRTSSMPADFFGILAVLQAALPSFNGTTTCPRLNWCSTSST